MRTRQSDHVEWRIKTTIQNVPIYLTFITYTSLICLPWPNEIVKSLLIVHYGA